MAAGAAAGHLYHPCRAGHRPCRRHRCAGFAGHERAPDLPLPLADNTPYRITPLWSVKGKHRAWLDFANDVTTKDVGLAAQEGYTSVEHMKRYTTQGMAPDQGKNSNVAGLAVLADATGRGIAETGTTTYPPALYSHCRLPRWARAGAARPLPRSAS